MTKPKRILITGANGAIGQAAATALRAAGHFIRGLDLQPSPDADEFVIASITDLAALQAAAQNIDAIIHLAATVNDADFLTQLLPNNIIGLYNILEAAVANHVPRICLASSMQTVSGLKIPADRILRLADGTSPLNHYAATKIYAEQMGLLYHNRHHLEVLCPRIGWLPRNPADARRLVQHRGQERCLSHDDAGRFFQCFVETPQIHAPAPGADAGYAIVFCLSARKNPAGPDPEPATTAIGYTPHDLFPAGIPFDF